MATVLYFYEMHEEPTLLGERTSLFNDRTIAVRHTSGDTTFTLQDYCSPKTLGTMYYDLSDECKNWLEQKNIKYNVLISDYDFYEYKRPIYIEFENECDAILFKMKYSK